MSNKKNDTKKNSAISPIINKISKKPVKANPPSPFQILMLENFISSLVIPKPLHTYTDKQMAELFHLKVVYKVADEMPKKVATILQPTDERSYNAVITTKKRDIIVKNSIIKEIATYLISMKSNGRIKNEYIRYKDEQETDATLLRDALVRIMLIPREDMLQIMREKENGENVLYSEGVTLYARKHNLKVEMVRERILDIKKTNTAGAYIELKDVTERTSFLPNTRKILDKYLESKKSTPQK